MATPGSLRPRSSLDRAAAVAVLLAAVALVAGPRAGGDLGIRLTAVSVTFVALVAESMPFLLAGAILAAAVRGRAGAKLLRALRRHPRTGAAVAPLSGVALPLCDCGIMPIARELRDGGAPTPAVNGFVAGAPLTNPIVILSTIVAFPGRPEIVTGRVVAGVAVAMLAAFVSPAIGARRTGPERHGEHAKGRGPLASVGHEFAHTAPTLALGALAAAVIKSLVPTEALVALESQPLLGAAAMMLLAFVMSICSQADAFVASSLPVGTLPRLAFITLGPMLDLRLAALYGREFGWAWLGRYAAIVVPGVLVLVTVWATWIRW